MRFLLPDEGVTLESLIESGAAVGGLQVYDNGVCLEVGKVHWSVPKFDVSSDLQLIDALKRLGVTDVFDDEKADFSPLVDLDEAAAAIEKAVETVLKDGFRTGDIMADGCKKVGCTEMGDLIAERI